MPVLNGNCLECDIAAFNEKPRVIIASELEISQQALDIYCNS